MLAAALCTISKGAVAGLIGVEGEPLTDVTALSRVRFVLLRGRLIVRD